MEINLSQKILQKYVCDLCSYSTSYSKDYKKHLQTKKHKSITMEIDGNIKEIKKILFCQNCDKQFLTNAGLWKHNKKCLTKKDITPIIPEPMNEEHHHFIQYFLKENSEFKQLMIEQSKQMLEQNKHIVELAKNSGHNNNSTNIVNNSQSFNLQFYLNETCKDAMNIMDFVSQLSVGITDLEETGRLGFAEGISKIFINGLKQININDRPIHCSDLKRETLYIKNNNEWNKETGDKLLLTNAIKHVAHKNMKQISDWTKSHPNYRDPSSKENDKYLQIVSEAMSGSTEEEQKII